MAEGAPLLREYRVNSSIEGSNPSVSAIRLRLRFGEIDETKLREADAPSKCKTE